MFKNGNWKMWSKWLLAVYPEKMMNPQLMSKYQMSLVEQLGYHNCLILHEFAKKIEKAGGKVLTEKMEVQGMGFTGHFRIPRVTSLNNRI